MLQGPEEIVESLIAWARRGPPGAVVAQLIAAEGDAQEPSYAGFELHPTV
jgi:hypothetical protein